MSFRVEQFAPARLDIAEILDYLLERSVSSAEKFLIALEQTYEYLSAYPESGSLIDTNNPRLHDIRIWQVKRFRHYLVFYRLNLDKIQVLRVLHSARDYAMLLEDE